MIKQLKLAMDINNIMMPWILKASFVTRVAGCVKCILTNYCPCTCAPPPVKNKINK